MSSRKVRVLQANKLYYPVKGGIEKVVQEISEGLIGDAEIENHVLVCQQKGKGICEQVNHVAVTRCRSLGVVSSLPISPEFIWRFRQMSKKQDIVHIHVPFPLGDLACLLSGFKGKVVVWWHSDIVRQKKLLKVYKPLMKWLLKRADAIVVATEGNIAGSQYLKPFASKCRVIPFGVNRELMQEADLCLSQKKEKRESIVKFLFTGRLVYYKGCDVLLKAFAGLKGKEAQLIMIGDGDLRKELEEMAKELGIREQVKFMGEVSQKVLVDNFADCDVFVLPSVAPSEAFGIVQIEAMAFGKPVINTNLKSGVPYVSRDGETGLTVEAGNAGQLTEAMERLLENRELREKYGKAAAERVRLCYNMDYMIGEIKKLYIELSNTKSRKD